MVLWFNVLIRRPATLKVLINMPASGPTDGGNGKILQKIIINKNSVWLDSGIMLDHGVFTNCGKINF